MIATVVADDRVADHHVPDDLAGALGDEGHLGYVLGRGADPVDEVGLGLRPYRDMMLIVGRLVGCRPLIVPAPLLSPRACPRTGCGS